MRKSKMLPFDLRATLVKNMPWASGLMALVISFSAAQGDWYSALYFGVVLGVSVVLRWFASDAARWNRYMGWLPDELKGEK